MVGRLVMRKSCLSTANGYCRSEAVCIVYLQKAKDARRVYATVVHAKTNCDGYKEQGITFPSGPLQQRLLEEFYEECQLNPSDLAWVEAHGTGTRVRPPYIYHSVSLETSRSNRLLYLELDVFNR